MCRRRAISVKYVLLAIAVVAVVVYLFVPIRTRWTPPGPGVKIIQFWHGWTGEYADTLAYVALGPSRRLFYCPDIDAWNRWDRDLRSFLADMDIALLDGTFFSSSELPGRDLAEIPHPLATDTARRLAGVDCDLRLIHLNHSNPLHYPGPERDWLAEKGVGVGAFGDRWSL